MDETFGEDPVLIGEMASAMVKGYQKNAAAGETFADDAILACAKHFAGYSYTQGGRDASEADLTHRALESWYLPPFERVAMRAAPRSCSATSQSMARRSRSTIGC